MTWWLLIGPGAQREQLALEGHKKPATLEGWRRVRIPRPGDLARERFDERARKWVSCPILGAEAEAREAAAARAWLDSLPPRAAELLAERAAEIAIARLQGATSEEGKPE